MLALIRGAVLKKRIERAASGLSSQTICRNLVGKKIFLGTFVLAGFPAPVLSTAPGLPLRERRCATCIDGKR